MVVSVESKICWYSFASISITKRAVDGTAISMFFSTKAFNSQRLVVQDGAVYWGADLLSFIGLLFNRKRKLVSMIITAGFWDPFYFLSLQFQIYLLFPLVIKSLGGHLQVHAVLYYVPKLKAYFSVKCWTFSQVDIFRKYFWIYFIYCYDKMLQKIF